MQNKLIITAAATLAGAILIKYFMNGRRFSRQQVPSMHADSNHAKKSHHVTDVFAHAKNQVG